MRLIISLFVFALFAVSQPALSAQTSGLYQVRLPVSNEQAEDRAADLNRALDVLVVRLTGDPAAVKAPALNELRKDPQQLVSQFGVEDNTLVVDFDPLTTENSLRQAGLALWGTSRPLILVWWLDESDGSSTLAGDSQELAAPLQAAAQNHGLPISLPLADLQEQLAATSENLAAARPDALLAVSQRYAADALLGVVALSLDGKWQAQWRLWLGDSREQGSVEAADQAALADAVMQAVSLRLAPRFIIAPGAAQQLTLVVQGVELQRMAELERLLKPFSARLHTAQGGTLTYQLNASPEQLRAQLALGQLHEVSTTQPQAEPMLSPLSTSVEQAGQTAPVPEPASSSANVLTFAW